MEPADEVDLTRVSEAASVALAACACDDASVSGRVACSSIAAAAVCVCLLRCAMSNRERCQLRETVQASAQCERGSIDTDRSVCALAMQQTAISDLSCGLSSLTAGVQSGNTLRRHTNRRRSRQATFHATHLHAIWLSDSRGNARPRSVAFLDSPPFLSFPSQPKSVGGLAEAHSGTFAPSE